LNFTDLLQKLKSENYIQGAVPRWILRGNSTTTQKTENSWAITNMLIVDSNLENKYGMGRKLQLSNLGLYVIV
jgi:hypothetical protein